MRWTTSIAGLFGQIEEHDTLSEALGRACRSCGCSFDSVTLGLHELAFVDDSDVEALTAYCQQIRSGGGRVLVRPGRPALRRLLLSTSIADLVDDEEREPEPGPPHDCPHGD